MSELLAEELAVPPQDAPGFELGFIVDDADQAYDELVNAGAAPACAPRDRVWGQRTAYVRDPDGVLLELVQTLPHASKRP